MKTAITHYEPSGSANDEWLKEMRAMNDESPVMRDCKTCGTEYNADNGDCDTCDEWWQQQETPEARERRFKMPRDWTKGPSCPAVEIFAAAADIDIDRQIIEAHEHGNN